MIQDDSSVGWDPTLLPIPISPIVRIYALFLFVAIAVALGNLIRLWIACPPFRLARQANNANYLQQLRTAYVSLKQWMLCTLLGCAFVASVELSRVSGRLLETRLQGSVPVLFAIRNFSIVPEMALFVTLFLFLAQWHLLNRIQRLGK